jgi:hypothetical protein
MVLKRIIGPYRYEDIVFNKYVEILNIFYVKIMFML